MEISRHHDGVLKQLWHIKTTVMEPNFLKKRKEKKILPHHTQRLSSEHGLFWYNVIMPVPQDALFAVSLCFEVTGE